MRGVYPCISAEDSRNRPTCSQNIRRDSLLRGETGSLPVRVRLSLRLSLFVVGSARRLRLPTSASTSTSSPSYQLSTAPCRCARLLPPLPQKPLSLRVVLSSSQSASSTARSSSYPSIPLVVSLVSNASNVTFIQHITQPSGFISPLTKHLFCLSLLSFFPLVSFPSLSLS